MNFNEIEITNNTGSKFISPGVEVLKFSEIKSGSANTGTPYIEITAENEAGLTCSTRFYFAEGKNREISAQTMFSYIAVTNGLDITQEEDKTKVKAMLGDFADYDQLASKMATLTIGKPMAMIVKGEVVTLTDSAKKQWTKGILSSIVNTVANKSKLTFNAEKHIKGVITNTSDTPAVVVETKSDW